MSLQNFEIQVESKFEKSEKNDIHPYLILLWIKHPSIRYCDLVSLAVFLDCFKDDGYQIDRAVEGLVEELFFAVVPKSEEETFHFYTLVRYIQQVVSYKDQRLLLKLLRERELE